MFHWLQQGFGSEKDENRSKFIGSNLIIKNLKNSRSVNLSKSEATFIVYSEPIKCSHVKINFS